MRANLTKLLCGVLLGAALTGPAVAQDRLVMPFACRVAGGQVSLAPSAPQAYEIYGQPEHRQMTTCSPYDPRKCHNWAVHRFDLDCGGVRTSWHSVVTALAPILAESLGPGDAYGGGPAYARAPARRYQAGPGSRISFPPGFAPNPMQVAKFERAEIPAAHIPLPPQKPEETTPAQVAEAAPGSEAHAVPSTAKDAATKAEGPSKSAPAASKTAELAEPRALKIEIEHGSGEVTGALPKPETGSLWRDASMVFTLMLAALLALTAVVLWRRRAETLPMLVPRLPRPAAPPALRRASGTDLDSVAADEHTGAPASRLRLWDEDWLPATTTEALDVLGVDPQAGRDRIKSTVTRLRRALHPDYALDEEDRRLRERRLKQINVAWEIVSGRRRAAWLSVKARAS